MAKSLIIPGVNFTFMRNVLLKGVLIFVVLSLGIGAIPANTLGRLSIYNYLIPGRPRLPFGETPQRSYNLSLNNLDAMFAAHEISGPQNLENETRIILLGDSSIWGILLKPEETLAGQLNARNLQICGKRAYFYNLGYPTISLAKDVLILQRALQTKPEMVVWVTTLEAFPMDKQFASPLVKDNHARLQSLLGIDTQSAVISVNILDNTIFGRRRELADWVRLQLYGIPWAATGIDQDYPVHYPAAEIDLESDAAFHNLLPASDLNSSLAWDMLKKGISLAEKSGLQVLLVNEPILISNGKNSNVRYNFYYPRWAYDDFREKLQQEADQAGWQYLDAWDAVPVGEFTNSAIHLTPEGENVLAGQVAAELQNMECVKK
jgi:hypothetical protein